VDWIHQVRIGSNGTMDVRMPRCMGSSILHSPLRSSQYLIGAESLRS